MSAIRLSSYEPKFERSDEAFTVVHRQALAQAEVLVDKTQEYTKEIFGGLALIKRIDCTDKGFVLMQVAKDGRIFVRGFSPSDSWDCKKTMHLISMRDNKPVTEDVTQTFRKVCGDLFLEEKEHYLPPDPQKAAPTSQTPDPTAPKPNQAQQAAGATISNSKPIEEASIQMHQGQSSGSPDCGGGCNSKGCTIM